MPPAHDPAGAVRIPRSGAFAARPAEKAMADTRSPASRQRSDRGAHPQRMEDPLCGAVAQTTAGRILDPASANDIMLAHTALHAYNGVTLPHSALLRRRQQE